jgi:8-oxo-dGTP diphosphatase
MEQTGMERAVRVVAAVIERDGRFLAARRKSGGIGGDWEFPGGKLRDGETPERGLERELREELGVTARCGEVYETVAYRGAAAIDLLVYRVSLDTGDFTLTDHEEVRWLRPDDMDEARFSAPDRPVVRKLRGEGS